MAVALAAAVSDDGGSDGDGDGGGGGDRGDGRGSGDSCGDDGGNGGSTGDGNSKPGRTLAPLRGFSIPGGGGNGDGGEQLSASEKRDPTNGFLGCSELTSRENDLRPDISSMWLESAAWWLPLLR